MSPNHLIPMTACSCACLVSIKRFDLITHRRNDLAGTQRERGAGSRQELATSFSTSFVASMMLNKQKKLVRCPVFRFWKTPGDRFCEEYVRGSDCLPQTLLSRSSSGFTHQVLHTPYGQFLRNPQGMAGSKPQFMTRMSILHLSRDSEQHQLAAIR